MASNFRLALLGVLVLLASKCNSLPTWSICNGNGIGKCFNSISSGDCGNVIGVNPASASVEGMFIFVAYGYYENPDIGGQGRFLFQKKFGESYELLNEIIGKVTCIRRVGDQYDYKQSVVTTFGKLEFLTDNNLVHITNDTGIIGQPCNLFPIASLIISGNEDWTFYQENGSGVCLQVANRTSFVPALVKDIRTVGFEHDTICAVRRGCHSATTIILDNSVTSGPLKR